MGVSAFRTELSAEAQVGERGLSRLCRDLQHSVIPRGIAVRRQGSRDAVHVHQYADPTGVYPADVNDSCFRGGALDLDIQGFVYLAKPRRLLINQGFAGYSYAVACDILHAEKQIKVKATSGTSSQRVLVFFFFFFSAMVP